MSNLPKAIIGDTASHSGRPLASSASQDARALRSAKALSEAMLTLLETKAFDQITIRDICSTASVHYATFFRHFATKECLLESVATEQIARLNELTLAIRAAADTEAGFEALCTYVDDHRDLWATLLNGGAGGAMREEWIRQSKKVAATEGTANSWLPEDLGTICAATLIAETLAWWVAQPRSAYGVSEVARIMIRLLSNSVLAPD